MNTNWQELKREFYMRRENAISARDQRKEEIYRKIPEIKMIDQQITELGLSFTREAIKQQLAPESADFFEGKINELIEKKKRLLEDNGFPANYLEVEYTCKNCNDTGFVLDQEGIPSTTPCHCYRQLLVERFYDVSNLNSDGQTGFEFFNENYYSDSVADGTNFDVSPRTQALRVKEKCLDFVNNFEDTTCPNLYFTGPTGVGKTFLSKCIAIEVLKKGHTVLYLPAPAMFDIIYRSKYQFDSNVQDNTYQDILNTELLIIDDLGTESPSAAKYTELLTLLNYRSAKNTASPCKTILSTNLEPGDLHKIYSERVESRILGEYDILYLFGDDIRLVKRFLKEGI
ncbi:MAG: ATP-binding protein [Clostridiaceae bacterium]|nr:ATP-binding protein [Clostridiaceae bacterium]